MVVAATQRQAVTSTAAAQRNEPPMVSSRQSQYRLRNVGRRRGVNPLHSRRISSSTVIGVCIGVPAILCMILLGSMTSNLQARSLHEEEKPLQETLPQPYQRIPPAPALVEVKQSKDDSRAEEDDDEGQATEPPMQRGWAQGVKPQLLRTVQKEVAEVQDTKATNQQTPKPGQVLTAYLEPLDRSTWGVKPLPSRTFTSKDLTKVEYPQLSSCSKLPEQWPVDNFPDEDAFLPWIHDVFPTHDGKYIQFIAQNKRRCRAGSTPEDAQILHETEPQITLFQPVAVKRIHATDSGAEMRYRLSSHEEADDDGMETRFICRFKSTGEETLSEYNFNYEWASYRKRLKVGFHETGYDVAQVHTSQLTFRCPVPDSLVDDVRTGSTVANDAATMFVDLVPIRTPPRYGSPTAFLPPYYSDFRAKGDGFFNATLEWGQNHILPKLEDSGRWENIPICKPSLLTYEKQNSTKARVVPTETSQDQLPKQHHLVSCLWTSTGYTTRGNRFAINDGQRRLLEFISYHKMIGVDHFYLYDNSGAFSDDQDNSLNSIAQLFPDDVTLINWPSKICNNNKAGDDSPGERSSQYAAEASCRLRFGPHTNWIAQLDIDEYIVPMGNQTTILPLLDKLDDEGTKIVSFSSWRAWPRRNFIETPVREHGIEMCDCDQDCFQLRIPMNYTILQSYNCDRQKPGQKTKQVPAEKQIYRPDYVYHHFVHYSTVTGLSILNQQDTKKLGHRWKQGGFPDPLSRFGDEVDEGIMLHTKAMATQDTVFWETACAASYDGEEPCRLGTPFPDDMTGVNISLGDKGWKFNCYVNHKVEDYFVPLLEERMRDFVPELAERMSVGDVVPSR
eukprot:Nitzschia sp. Nitz4//scaffold88_size82704//57521//60269//NITZ4_005301-RA/size82704-augustus-gene-0.84-mRNA-1//-1//CDS//3329559521//8167//frame0